jgi:hypothetical protein
MKRKLQGSSAVWAPFKALGGVISFLKFAKARYLNQNQLRIIEVCQAVN